MTRSRGFAAAAAAAVLWAAALPLTAQQLEAQTPPGFPAEVFAATSAPVDAAELARADALIAEGVRAGALVVVTSQADRRLPGRVHEYLQQTHGGVPILGAGLMRQRTANTSTSAGTTISVFGSLVDDVDVDTEPSLAAEAAIARMEAVAGAAPATGEPPRLAILRSPLGQLVLAWSAPMQDFRTHFIDAHTGEPVHVLDHVRSSNAVGSGVGITGARQKLSTWRTGQSFQAWDRLRPAEIVTLDAGGGTQRRAFELLRLGSPWQNAIATDDDNQWPTADIVDGHAHIGFVYDYIFRTNGWRGLDGRNGRIFSVVNVDVANAFAISAPFGPEGKGAMMFGKAQGGRALVPLDVVGHEFQHIATDAALVARTMRPLIGAQGFMRGPSVLRVRGDVVRCGDVYTFNEGEENEARWPILCYDANGEPTRSRDGRLALFMDHGGAIHEAYADITGTAVEFAIHPPGNGPLRADYLLGEDAEAPFRRIDDPRSVALGPFTYPDALGQEFRFVVAHVQTSQGDFIAYTGFGMKGDDAFRLGSDGYTASHWNSTILSHAFYLAIEGGRHGSTGRTIQGVGGPNRVQVEQAFFKALVDLIPSNASYPVVGATIRQAAMDLHGAGSAAHAAIDQALTATGL